MHPPSLTPERLIAVLESLESLDRLWQQQLKDGQAPCPELRFLLPAPFFAWGHVCDDWKNCQEYVARLHWHVLEYSGRKVRVWHTLVDGVNVQWPT